MSSKLGSLGLLLLLLSASSIGQDPGSAVIALEQADMPAGLELVSSGAWSPILDDGFRPLVDDWVGVESRVSCLYAVLESADRAMEAFNAVRDGRMRLGKSIPLAGDQSAGNPGSGSIAFIHGRAVVKIWADAPWPTQREQLLLEVLERAEQKVLAAGFQPLPGFSFELNPISTTVNRATGEPVRLQIGGQGAGDLSFSVLIWDASGDLVLKIEDALNVGQTEFAWDGLDSQGREVPVGNYTARVVVVDFLSREADETVELSVLANQNPRSGILIAAKDAFLRHRDPHLNEGASPTLALMKITGKPARPVVGFDLSNLDTNAVSRATLVLTIDPADSPTGWGNGRTISVRRLLEPWVEGNGVSGPGVTWFNPVDSDVSNNGPDGPLQWAGGDLASDTPTAAPATITNHLTGEVSFDVTWDVLNGADQGWLVVRDNENVGSKVRFYSREGAAAAGTPDLAPRLLLEFGNTGRAGDSRLLARAVRLVASEPRDIELGGKLSRGTAAVLVEELAVLAIRPLPFAELPTRLIYWLWNAADHPA